MSEITIEEALAYFKNREYMMDSSRQDEMSKIAISAIEMQNPKKVDEDGWGWNECTVCHNRGDNLLSGKFMWCPYCGHKLDWD